MKKTQFQFGGFWGVVGGIADGVPIVNRNWPIGGIIGNPGIGGMPIFIPMGKPTPMFIGIDIGIPFGPIGGGIIGMGSIPIGIWGTTPAGMAPGTGTGTPGCGSGAAVGIVNPGATSGVGWLSGGWVGGGGAVPAGVEGGGGGGGAAKSR